MSLATVFFASISERFIDLPVWMEMLILATLFFGLLIFFWAWISKIKHQKKDLQRQLIEKTELLLHTTQRETKAREKAIEIAESKTKLLNRLNYEIRTPMSGVMGMVSLLAETPLNPEQREFNDTIRNCSESLINVINDILLGDVLAHAKIESGAELEQNEFDLRNAIEEIFEVFANQVSQKDVELIYQVDHRIPAKLIGDNNRLKQVLMNLVDNAIRFTKQGEIFVRVWIKGEGANGMIDLGFEVKDSGVGMAADELKFLMHTISEPGAQRSGVGLFLCNRLVDIMGGEFNVDSQVKEGTTVRFNIQARIEATEQPANPDMAEIVGKRVLIVEDNQILRNVLREELLHWKLVPFIAENANRKIRY
jgi:signal transduction histidine kinase